MLLSHRLAARINRQWNISWTLLIVVGLVVPILARLLHQLATWPHDVIVDMTLLPAITPVQSTMDRNVVLSLRKNNRTVITVDGVPEFVRYLHTRWHPRLRRYHQSFCRQLHAGDQLNIRINCRAAHAAQNPGTGNYMSEFYKLRAQGYANGWTVRLQCDDAVAEQDNLVLPWLMGTFGGPRASSLLLSNNTCTQPARLASILPQIQLELRRMARFQLQQHRAHLWPTLSSSFAAAAAANLTVYQPTLLLAGHVVRRDNNTPVRRNITLDDVVIHFRCGDLADSVHTKYGFLQFRAFADRIPNNVTTIGIVTQPFELPQHMNATTAGVRAFDVDGVKGPRCRRLVQALTDVLQARFVNASISVYNDEHETPIVAISRMILAPVAALAGQTTFGVWGSLATVGQGHVLVNTRGGGSGATAAGGSYYSDLPPNIHFMEDEPLLAAAAFQRLMRLPPGDHHNNTDGFGSDGAAHALRWLASPVKLDSILQ